MIFTDSYTVEYDEKRDRYKIKSLVAPICPDCGLLLSGYDTRPRHIKDGTGACRWYLLRRLRCAYCDKLHLEAPDFIQPQKHYDGGVIADTIAGVTDSCPADNATIRRWRKNYPPGLPMLR